MPCGSGSSKGGRSSRGPPSSPATSSLSTGGLRRRYRRSNGSAYSKQRGSPRASTAPLSAPSRPTQRRTSAWFSTTSRPRTISSSPWSSTCMLDNLGRALAGDTPVRERLKGAFLRLGCASNDELEVVRLVVREVLLSSPRFHRVLARARAGHLAMLLSVLQEGVRRGEIDSSIPLPMLLVTTFAMGGVPQLVRRAAGSEPPFSALASPNQLAEASVELLFRAIGNGDTKRPARPKSKKRVQSHASRPRAPRG